MLSLKLSKGYCWVLLILYKQGFTIRRVLFDELLLYTPSISEKRAITEMNVVWSRAKSVLLGYVKTKDNFNEWPLIVGIIWESTQSRVENLMPYMKIHWNIRNHCEPCKTNVSTLVSFNGNFKELHVLVDRNDGIFRYCDTKGYMMCLKDWMVASSTKISSKICSFSRYTLKTRWLELDSIKFQGKKKNI